MPTAGDWIATRDGRALYAERKGDGPPIVVFESGMGSSRLAWAAVVEALAGRLTTVVYDRSGLGRSEPTDGQRDLAMLAGDLGDVLDAIGSGPFVLVGHSWGGPIARVTAAAQPERVAGMVLVDPTDERCDLLFDKAQSRFESLIRPVVPIAARLGLFKPPIRRLAAHLPDDAAAQMRAEEGTPAALAAAMAEMTTWIADLKRLRDDPPDIPDVPFTIISGGRVGKMERNRRPALIDAHRASVAAAPQGRHVLAPSSTHYVPFTDPQLVADEILRIAIPLTESRP